MNKRLAMLALVSVMTATLASCGEGYDYRDGKMLYINGEAYTTDELFKSFNIDTSTGVKAYYDVLNNIAIEATVKKTDDMKATVTNAIKKDFTEKAKSNASTNGTTESEELEKLLDAAGYDTLEEATDGYFLKEKKSKASKEYQEAEATYTSEFIPEFVKTQAPYHVKHILVKFDSSANGSLYQGTISKDDAKDLANVIERLAGSENFGSVAMSKSDDTSSAAKYGDTGIMSKTTSFNNEFKLNIYAYDAFFNSAVTSSSQEVSRLKSTLFSSNADIAAKFAEVDGSKAYGIPYSAVKEMEYYADKTTDANGVAVTGAQEYNYPRNVIYNNYFNQHGLSFIYLDQPTAATSAYYTQADYDAISADKFKTVTGISDKLQQYVGQVTTGSGVTYATRTVAKDIASAPILVDETGKPILVTKTTAGSGDSAYAGVHFIVIQNDPFGVDTSKDYETALSEKYTALSDYYTLTKPSTSSNTTVIGSTYVSAITTTDTSKYDDRIKEIKTAAATIDSNMEYREYEHYMSMAKNGTNDNGDTNGITISIDPTIEAKVNYYIEGQRTSTKDAAVRTADSSWQTFTELLDFSKTTSYRIIPVESGIEAFLGGSTTLAAFNTARAAE
jgi:hypothetical protein